jgi:hypothetical protein
MFTTMTIAAALVLTAGSALASDVSSERLASGPIP